MTANGKGRLNLSLFRTAGVVDASGADLHRWAFLLSLPLLAASRASLLRPLASPSCGQRVIFLLGAGANTMALTGMKLGLCQNLFQKKELE